jgi:hypothetical protein
MSDDLDAKTRGDWLRAEAENRRLRKAMMDAMRYLDKDSLALAILDAALDRRGEE